jgi:hypothetical protein
MILETRRIVFTAMKTRAKWFVVLLALVAVVLLATECGSAPPPEPVPLPVSVSADSALRVPCEAAIRSAATVGRRVYREKEVNSPVALIMDNRGPTHPGESGTIEVELVVDSAGRADMATVRPLRPASNALLAAVREFYPTAKFKPGRVAGIPVAVCAQQKFVFASHKDWGRPDPASRR